MKRGYNIPDWLVRWNRAQAGETNDKFEHVVPSGQQKRYRHIESIEPFIAEYYAQHARPLTIPQLYYHLVRGEVIGNSTQAQSMLRNFIQTGLQWGLIDWDHIYDETLTVHGVLPANPEWPGLGLVEVWAEKPGFEDVIRKACRAFGCPWRVLRGRPTPIDICNLIGDFGDQPTHIVYLCDVDPVALVTVQHINLQLELFNIQSVTIDADLFNEQLIMEKQLPANPVSVTAHGAQDYLDRYGTTQWELEALAPHELDDLLCVRLDSLKRS